MRAIGVVSVGALTQMVSRGLDVVGAVSAAGGCRLKGHVNRGLCVVRAAAELVVVVGARVPRAQARLVVRMRKRRQQCLARVIIGEAASHVVVDGKSKERCPDQGNDQAVIRMFRDVYGEVRP